MKKTLLILSFILLSVVSFAQRQRTTAVFDSDTTTRPKAGFYGIGVRANNVYFIPPTGNNIRMANYSLFTGLTTNYLSKWNGSKFVNSAVFESGGNVGIGTASPSAKLHVNGNVLLPGTNSYYTYSQDYGLGTPNFSGLQVFAGDSDAIRLGRMVSGTFTDRLYIKTSDGNVGIGTTTPSSKLQVVGLPTYADNTAATIGGLTEGAFYRTVLGVLMVVY